MADSLKKKREKSLVRKMSLVIRLLFASQCSQTSPKIGKGFETDMSASLIAIGSSIPNLQSQTGRLMMKIFQEQVFIHFLLRENGRVIER